jgi:hypothetical protein
VNKSELIKKMKGKSSIKKEKRKQATVKMTRKNMNKITIAAMTRKTRRKMGIIATTTKTIAMKRKRTKNMTEM